MKTEDWKIDNSAGRPILTYKDCSVIEAQDAEFVLKAINIALLADTKKEINLNAKVRVQLTEHGKIILEMDEYASDKPDADGFLEMQLWTLMRVFGPVMFLGNPNMPFENMNVELLG